MALLQVGFVPARRSHFRITRRDRSLAHSLRLGVLALLAVVLLGSAPGPARAAAPEGQLTWGVHVSLAPTWFDPAETPGIITPFMVMYALHDAMVKPMPGNPFAPSLAESWSMSPDGLTYEFVLREGVKFHNGEPVTAEDVKFSFERYRGASAKAIKDRVAAVETPDPQHVRFKLKEPWPDFMTFYASATGAGWIVPKKYVEKVGDEGFKKAPIGAGPYKFVSFTPGVELALEAFDGYWRKTPSVKRLVFKVDPRRVDAAGRAQARRGRHRLLDPRRARRGAASARKGLTLKPTVIQAPFWLYFPDQWDPKSPWHDPARAAGGEPRHRPQDHQPGADARPLQDHRQHHPRQLRILLAAAGAGLRPGQGQEAAGRGRSSQRLRRRRLLLRHLLRQRRRGGDQQPPGGRHPRQAAAARAGGLLQGLLRRRSSRTSSRGRAAPSATPPRGSRRSW